MVSDETSTIIQISFLFSPMAKVSLFFFYFQVFSLSLALKSLTMMCPGMDFLEFILNL